MHNTQPPTPEVKVTQLKYHIALTFCIFLFNFYLPYASTDFNITTHIWCPYIEDVSNTTPSHLFLRSRSQGSMSDRVICLYFSFHPVFSI